MKEEQFVRQTHKLETHNKSEAKRLQEKYEGMLQARLRDNECHV